MKKRAGDTVEHDPPPPYLRPHTGGGKSALLRWCDESVDILFAKKFGKRHLIRCGEAVEVESLKGKLIGLLFVNSKDQHHVRIGCSELFDAYYRLKELNKFEIVYVTVPPTHPCVTNRTTRPPGETVYQNFYNLKVFTAFTSSLPFLSIPFADEAWRYFLCTQYTELGYPLSDQLTIINHSGDVLNHDALLADLPKYGHLLYPFTLQRKVQLADHFRNMREETDINLLLASKSNGGFLINRHHQRVPISQLEDKHVAFYSYNRSSPHSHAFLEQLLGIYEQFHHLGGFEIVFVNCHSHRGRGYQDKESFDEALESMPWLALPFRDDSIWCLEHIFHGNLFLQFDDWFDYPTLFIRAKGEAVLDPYGYHVFNKYGLDAYPFTRRAALRSERRRLKAITFKSFLKEAESLGLDFSSLIKIKDKDGLEVEEIALSDLKLKKRGRGILLVFASSSNFFGKAFESLIESYTHSASSSFEVIYVSLDKHRDVFRSHLSDMPWLSLHRRLKKKEHKELVERTIKFRFEDGYCIAFGPRGNFLTMGDLPVSFEDRAFPFIKEVEFINAMAMCMLRDFGWKWDVDVSLGTEENIDWLDD